MEEHELIDVRDCRTPSIQFVYFFFFKARLLERRKTGDEAAVAVDINCKAVVVHFFEGRNRERTSGKKMTKRQAFFHSLHSCNFKLK